MKLELKDNKVFFESKGLKKEIHPFWLRERVNGENFVDKSTQQRLFDPTQLQENIQIKKLNLSSDFLEIKFNDGASTKISIIDIFKEFSNINDVKQIEKIKWDYSFKDQNTFKFKVEVILKNGVLDPQGEAIKQSININNLGNVLDVKQGKLFELSVSSKDIEHAISEVKKICSDLLANSVIEDFKYYEVSE